MSSLSQVNSFSSVSSWNSAPDVLQNQQDSTSRSSTSNSAESSLKKRKISQNWTKRECSALNEVVDKYSKHPHLFSWSKVAVELNEKGFDRTGKQCRERSVFQENPYLIKPVLQSHEDKLLYLNELMDSKWSKISSEIRKHNGGYLYSAPIIREFCSLRSPTRKVSNSLKDEYAHLSTTQLKVKAIAKSLNLGEIKRGQKTVQSTSVGQKRKADDSLSLDDLKEMSDLIAFDGFQEYTWDLKKESDLMLFE